MWCSNGGKIPPVFGKELNTPSLLPGPVETRWAEAAKLVSLSFQMHSEQETSPGAKSDIFVVWPVETTASRQNSALPKADGDGLATSVTGLRQRDFKEPQFRIPAEPIKQFILGQIKCLSCSYCAQIFSMGPQRLSSLLGLAESKDLMMLVVRAEVFLGESG